MYAACSRIVSACNVLAVAVPGIETGHPFWLSMLGKSRNQCYGELKNCSANVGCALERFRVLLLAMGYFFHSVSRISVSGIQILSFRLFRLDDVGRN